MQCAITRVAVPRRASGPDPEPPPASTSTNLAGIGAKHPLMTAVKYRDLIVAYKGGRPIRLSDVATAVDSA